MEVQTYDDKKIENTLKQGTSFTYTNSNDQLKKRQRQCLPVLISVIKALLETKTNPFKDPIHLDYYLEKQNSKSEENDDDTVEKHSAIYTHEDSFTSKTMKYPDLLGLLRDKENNKIKMGYPFVMNNDVDNDKTNYNRINVFIDSRTAEMKREVSENRILDENTKSSIQDKIEKRTPTIKAETDITIKIIHFFNLLQHCYLLQKNYIEGELDKCKNYKHEIKQLKGNIDRLKNQIDTFKKEISDNTTKSVEAAKEEKERTDNKTAALEKTIAEAAERAAMTAEDRNADAQKAREAAEAAEVARKAAEMAREDAVAAATKLAEADKEAAKAELVTAKADLETAKAELETAKQDKKQLLKNIFETLSNYIKAEKSSGDEDLRKIEKYFSSDENEENISLNSTIEKVINNYIKTLQKENKNLGENINMLENQIETIGTENTSSVSEVQKLRDELEDNKKATAAATAAHEEAQAQAAAAAGEELAKVKAELAEQNVNIANMEASMLQKKGEMEQQEARISEENKLLREREKEAREKEAAARKETEEARKETEVARKETEVARNAAAADKKTADNATKEYSEKLKDLTRLIKKWNEEAERLAGGAQKILNTENKDKVKDLNDKVDKLYRKMNDNKANIDVFFPNVRDDNEDFTGKIDKTMQDLKKLKKEIKKKLKQLEDPLKIEYLNKLIENSDASIETNSSPMIKAIEAIIQGGRPELQKQIDKTKKKKQIIAAIENMKDIDNNLRQFVNYMKKLQEKRDEISDNDRVNNINEFSNKLHDYLKWYFKHMYKIVFAEQTLKKEYERILILFKIRQMKPGRQKLNIINEIVNEENGYKWENQWSYLNQDISSDKRELKTHLSSIIKNIENKKLEEQKARQRGKRLNRNALDTVSTNENEDTIIENFIKKIMKTQLGDTLLDKIKNFKENLVSVMDNDISTFREKIYAYEKEGGSDIRLAYSSNNEQDRGKPAVILDKKKLQFILQELVENDYKKHQSEEYLPDNTTDITSERSTKQQIITKLNELNTTRKNEVKEAKKRYVKLKRNWDLLGSKLVEKDTEAKIESTLLSNAGLYGGSTGGRNKIYKYSINAKKVVTANSTTKKKNKSKSKRR